MGIFEGVLICTDLDGTLLRNDKSISRENLDAIEYFKAQGGLFTIVTGRMPFYVKFHKQKQHPDRTCHSAYLKRNLTMFPCCVCFCRQSY